MDKLLMTDVITKLLKYSEVQTDHGVFRLHYKITAVLFLGCSILVSATQFFGDPISCVSYDMIPKNILNQYCWVEGTITLPRSLNGTLNEDVAAPGVDQRKIRDDEPVIEHSYYQWVSIFLFFQAATFYLPRWLWRIWEHGRMKGLINELSKASISKETKRKNVETIARYFFEHRFENQAYAYRFLACELLSMVNVLLQIYLLDRFLGYQFWTYGPAAVAYMGQDPETRVDPMARVFPKMSKCRMRRFGTSGEVQVHDAICLLSLNIINEKIFVCLWFWLMTLAIATFVSLVYRFVMIGVPKTRVNLLNSLARMVEKDDLQKVVDGGLYGDWFLLSLLKDNVKPHHFKDVVHTLGTHFDNGDDRLGYRLIKDKDAGVA